MNKAEMEAFIKEYLGGVRKAKKQLEDFEPEIKRLQDNATKIQESFSKILPATQGHANTITQSLDKVLPATQGHANTITQSLDKVLPATQGHANTITQSLDKVLPATQGHADTITQSLDKVLPTTQGHAKTITQSLDKVLPTTQGHAKTITQSLDNDAKTIRGHAQKTKTSISDQLKEAIPLISEIKDYHGELISGTKDIDGEDVPSTKTKMTKYITDQQEQFETLREELRNKILDLLPGATVARLSNAYREAKERYGSVPDKKNFGVGWFHALFIIPLSVIIFLILSGDTVGLLDIIGADGSINSNALLNRFLISSPFATLSWFGWSSIRLNRRLYEEYNHKQRVMQLYHGFNGEIEEYGREDQKQKLLDIMLQNVADKPSLAVHSGKKKINQISFLWGMFVLTRGVEKLYEPTSDTDDTLEPAPDTDDTPEPAPAVNKKTIS